MKRFEGTSHVVALAVGAMLIAAATPLVARQGAAPQPTAAAPGAPP